MSYTPETIGENLRVWKDRVSETAHCLLDDEVSTSDKGRELVRYAIISESYLFAHIGLGFLWLGFSTNNVLRNSYQLAKIWVGDEKQNLDEIAKYCAGNKYSPPNKRLNYSFGA